MRLIKCPYCQDQFMPNYYENVHVPCPAQKGDPVTPAKSGRNRD